jgi:hypothetical protein
MDPNAVSTIAASAVSLLVPYLAKVADKASEEFGKAVATNAWERTKQLYQTIRVRFGGKEAAKEAFDDLERAPNDPDLQAAVRVQLRKFIQDDEDFAKQIADLLKSAADADVDTVFNTQINGDVNKLVQMGTVYGDVTI